MALPTKHQAGKLWKQYVSKPTTQRRNDLMVLYLPLVRFNADRISAKLPDEVDPEDLMSSGVFGLMDAIDSFDPARGVKFETYCAPRIRGAMLDELRSMDWVPRLVRSRASRLESIRRALETELGRTPTQAEIANRMGLKKADFEKVARDANAVNIVSLSRKHYETDSNREVTEIDILEDRRSTDPEQEVQKRALTEAFQRLTRIEQLILVLYYFEDMTMKEIGKALDLSESRVSQMHSSIIRRLQSIFEEQHEPCGS